jgi:hypothetical protein
MIDCRSSRARLQKDALAGDSGAGGGMTLNCIAHSLWIADPHFSGARPPSSQSSFSIIGHLGFRHLVQIKPIRMAGLND